MLHGEQQRLAGSTESVPEEQAAALREAFPGHVAEGLEIEQKRAGSNGGSGGSSGEAVSGGSLAKFWRRGSTCDKEIYKEICDRKDVQTTLIPG